MIHEGLWEQLREARPDEVCRRTGATFDEAEGWYELPVLGETMRVSPAERHMVAAREEGLVEPAAGVCQSSIVYLLTPREIVVSGEWVSPLELPTGALFFRGPHVAPVGQIEEVFGEALGDFRRACGTAGGTALEFADASYRFQVFPRLPLAVLLWAADDEFGARARFLVDGAASQGMALDLLLSVMGMLAGRLVAAGSGPEE